MPQSKNAESLSEHPILRSDDPYPFAEGRQWRQAGRTAEVQRVLHAGQKSWRKFAPTAVEFAVVALGIENDRPTDAVLQNEIGPEFWETTLGIGLPGSYALPDPSFVLAFMEGVLDA